MANKPTRIIYALYHGDDFIDSGTAKELSRKYHRSRSWIYSLAADRNVDKAETGNRTIAVKLAEVEE
ncbi:hypothetical protein [Lacticaseibacillus saniviri]